MLISCSAISIHLRTHPLHCLLTAKKSSQKAWEFHKTHEYPQTKSHHVTRFTFDWAKLTSFPTTVFTLSSQSELRGNEILEADIITYYLCLTFSSEYCHHLVPLFPRVSDLIGLFAAFLLMFIWAWTPRGEWHSLPLLLLLMCHLALSPGMDKPRSQTPNPARRWSLLGYVCHPGEEEVPMSQDGAQGTH